MPTTMRFITIILMIAAVIYAAMFALATFVSPRQSQLTQKIELSLPGVAKPAPTDDSDAGEVSPAEPLQ